MIVIVIASFFSFFLLVYSISLLLQIAFEGFSAHLQTELVELWIALYIGLIPVHSL